MSRAGDAHTPDTAAGSAAEPAIDDFPADVMARACSSREVLHHVTGRWGALSMVSLARCPQPLRFGEVRRGIEGISDRMLSRTLGELERDGLVVRTVRSAIPPHVDYALTPLGRTVAVPLIALINAIEDDLPAVMAARATHDETRAPTGG